MNKVAFHSIEFDRLLLITENILYTSFQSAKSLKLHHSFTENSMLHNFLTAFLTIQYFIF